jgi:hypothetical protein
MRGLASVLSLALFVAACTSLPPTTTPTELPSASPSPSSEPLPSPDPTLHIDGLATIARDGLRIWLDPANGDTGRKKDFLSLVIGSKVRLVDGPVAVDGVLYWQIYPSTRDYTSPLGWVAATKADGTANIAPFQPSCPQPAGITAAQLGVLEPMEQLSCIGNQELTLEGVLTCNYGIGDGILGGPMMNANVWCLMDDAISLFGSVITSAPPRDPSRPVFTGHYRVRGHFDDPGAQGCIQIPFATPMTVSRFPGDPGAIQACRAFFVVASAEELTG